MLDNKDEQIFNNYSWVSLEDISPYLIDATLSTEDKHFYLEHADLIIVAAGRAGVLNKSYKLKESAVVMDVGINFDENGKLIGDCEKDLPVAFQSQVPSGCGLLTRLAVIENLVFLSNK